MKSNNLNLNGCRINHPCIEGDDVMNSDDVEMKKATET